MSYGFRARNTTNDHITIDENLRAYVYLAKYPIPTQIGTSVNVDFTCAGVPLVFFQVPYNVATTGTSPAGSVNSYSERPGISMSKLANLGGNTWRATFTISNQNGPELGLYMRVFGLLNLNYPNGSNETHGARIRSPAGQIVFDAGLKMMRLAGDTYGTELVLKWEPPSQGQNANVHDTAVNLPFSMAGKSIAATARGLVSYPYLITSYFDVGLGTQVDQYEVHEFQTVYWANGTQLQVRRASVNYTIQETTGYMPVASENCQTVYSRLAVIDNSQFP